MTSVPDPVRELARAGRLYPAMILYGSTAVERREAAVAVARTLLCEHDPPARPCGECRQCRRIEWPAAAAEKFHPDFHVLERDLRTTTSIDATKSFLHSSFSAPFEARGQVFVLAEAESLSGGAADALLKILEEPPARTPRHFLLLTPSRLDLSPTLRSRSLAVYLGSPETLDEATIAEIAEDFARALDGYLATSSAMRLLQAAGALAQAPGWNDPRARKPWATAAAAVLDAARRLDRETPARRALLAFAEELLDAWRLRLRGITHERILEGLLARHLAGI
ncbi:MAG: hypothetical protein GY856_34180 [bacterium]|nr:hypothetical protein [bacterium]